MNAYQRESITDWFVSNYCLKIEMNSNTIYGAVFQPLLKVILFAIDILMPISDQKHHLRHNPYVHHIKLFLKLRKRYKLSPHQIVWKLLQLKMSRIHFYTLLISKHMKRISIYFWCPYNSNDVSLLSLKFMSSVKMLIYFFQI